MKRYVVSVQISDIFVNIIFSFQPKYTQLHLLFIQFASLFRDPRLTKEFSVNCYSWNEQETYLRMQRYFHQRSSFHLFLSRIPTCRYLHATTVNTLTIWMFLANKTFTQRVTVCFVFFSLITGHRVEERGPEVPQLTSPTRGEGRIFLLSPMTVYRYDGYDCTKVHYVRASTLLRSYVIYRWWARRIGFLLRRPPLPSEWLWQKLVEPLEPKPTTQSLSAC